jgi:hypothetical protein
MSGALDFTWSPTEKKIARAAFDSAYERECAGILREVNKMLADATDSQVVWKIEKHIEKRRRDMEHRYDFRYSVLLMHFAGMLRDRVLTEEDLSGLSSDKMETIRRFASL